MLVADVIQEQRQVDIGGTYEPSVLRLISSQGVSLNVTEVVSQYRDRFSPYYISYLWTELQNAFVPTDTTNYRRGKSLAIDVSVLLSPEAYSWGYGTAGSYIPEAYAAGGISAVVLISVVLGLGLHAFYRFSGSPLLLFLFAMSLPDILLMPKGQLLDWASILLKNTISLALLWVGWQTVQLAGFGEARPRPRRNQGSRDSRCFP